MPENENDEVFRLHGGKEQGVLSISPRFDDTTRTELGEVGLE